MSVIHGTVRLSNGKILHNALVRLYKVDDNDVLSSVSFTITDEDGEFLFEVANNQDYIIKVFNFDLKDTTAH